MLFLSSNPPYIWLALVCLKYALLRKLMMASGNIFWLAFYVLIGHEINSVQTLISCKAHKDCEGKIFGLFPHCCGGTSSSFDIARRSCQRGDCLGHYCETDSDCGDSTHCCRSNRCAKVIVVVQAVLQIRTVLPLALVMFVVRKALP